ncbi:MAG: hypothetical protein ABSG36_14880 [Acidimicrobiales bacterium]
MKAFAMLTAAVLIVIGIGVSLLASESQPTVIPCTPLSSCLLDLHAYGIDARVLVPGDRHLTFTEGLIYPNEHEFLTWTPADKPAWGMRLYFSEQNPRSWDLEWVMDAPFPPRQDPWLPCPPSENSNPLIVSGGFKVCSTPSYHLVHFYSANTYYFADTPGSQGWLISEVAHRRLVYIGPPQS